MDSERLATGPGITDDRGLADVHHLFDHVELAKPVVPLELGGESVELRRVLAAHVLDMAQPVVGQP